jgi:hypothetical protein
VCLSPAKILYIYRELIPGIRDVDWHRFDADPDSDPTFNINADPAPGFTPLEHVGKSELVLTFMHSSASLHCFIFLATVIGVIILNFLGQHVTYCVLKFSGKKYTVVYLYIWLKRKRIQIRMRRGIRLGRSLMPIWTKNMPVRPDPDPQHCQACNS